MKGLKKALAAITAAAALTVSCIPVSAYDVEVGNHGGSSSSTDIVKTFTNGGRTTEYSISDSGISIYEHAESSGIVFQLKKGADISSLGLKYDFEHKSSVSLGGWCYEFDWYYNSPYSSRTDFDADDFYVYLADYDTPEEELISYAQELSEKEGVLYADEFNLTVYDSGYVENASKGNCCLYLNFGKAMSNEYMEKYVKKLNADKELTDYLESIGADKKITIDKAHKMPRISGIDDNTRIFEIMDELRAFDDIDNATFICAMLCTPRYGIKVAEHEDKTTEDKADDSTAETTGVLPEETADAAADADDSKEDTPVVLPEDKTDTIDDTATAPTEQPLDNVRIWNVRDCAEIARAIANGNKDTLTFNADYNGDGKVDIRDAAAIARDLAAKK